MSVFVWCLFGAFVIFMVLPLSVLIGLELSIRYYGFWENLKDFLRN